MSSLSHPFYHLGWLLTGVVAAIHSFRGYIEQTIFDSSYLLRSKLTPLLKNVYLFNHSNCSNPSLEVVVYLFWSMKARQSSILWSVLCRFHSLYHCCHLLSLTAFCCHLLSLVVLLAVTLCACFHVLSFVVIRCHSLYHPLSLVVIRCHLLYYSLSLVVIYCHSLSLDVPLVCLFINDRLKISLRHERFTKLCRMSNQSRQQSRQACYTRK